MTCCTRCKGTGIEPTKKPRARKNGPGYTEPANGKPARCRGCGAIAGNGHHQGCWDRTNQRHQIKIPATPRAGTAARAKLEAKIAKLAAEHAEKMRYYRYPKRTPEEALEANKRALEAHKQQTEGLYA